ncbi:MAG: alpha/beta fold hydrolase [Clostridia bacterium]|nr:alpha/beta fold hydrolase [Clostridia bacterium]
MLFENKIKEAYLQRICRRYDDEGLARYFTHHDFDGLKAEAFSFEGREGHALNGAFYYYDGYRADKLVVFDHGMGGGHLSYMREIERICRAGYRVFSYDHTGCMTSGGEGTGGFARSLDDLGRAINALKVKLGEDMAFSVIGHSWGGYSTLNIASLHPDIESIVAISGFSSVKRMLDGVFSAYAPLIMKLEEGNAIPTLGADAATSLADYKGRALVIHSKDDRVVSAKKHFAYLKEALAVNENVRFMLVNGKAHNPNYTQDAVKYLAAYVKTLTRRLRKGTLATPEAREEFVASFDWWRMTEQDEAVWKEIIDVIG